MHRSRGGYLQLQKWRIRLLLRTERSELFRFDPRLIYQTIVSAVLGSPASKASSREYGSQVNSRHRFNCVTPEARRSPQRLQREWRVTWRVPPVVRWPRLEYSFG